MTGSGVIVLTIQNGGTGFTSNPTLTLTGGGGTLATATATVTIPSPSGQIGTITLTNVGAGFTLPPGVTIAGGGGSGATAIALLTGSTVNSIAVGVGGSYTTVPTCIISDANGGTGVGATATITLAFTTINTLAVGVGGSGYTVVTVTISAPDDPTGTQATATGHLTGGVLTSITVDNAGTGYNKPPTVVVTGDGTLATATATIVATPILRFNVTNTGSGYQSPIVAVSSGAGTGIVHVSPTTLSRVVITAPGSGYSSPTVAFTNTDGGGEAATAALATGTITSVAITVAGINYTSAPTVGVSGGGGTGAVILAGIGFLTYVEVEPLSAVKDLVTRTTVDRSTFPPAKTYPVSIRVKKRDINNAGLFVLPLTNIDSNGNQDYEAEVGLAELTLIGGSGPVLGFVTEQYMTDTEYAAYVPGAFSTTGDGLVSTMIYSAYMGFPGSERPVVRTFKINPISNGTSAGIMDVSAEKQRYGVRLVRTLFLTSSY